MSDLFLEIANKALRLTRNQGINSLDEESAIARNVRSLVPDRIASEFVAGGYPWTFATRRGLLAADGDFVGTEREIHSEWSYRYTPPADFLTLDWVDYVGVSGGSSGSTQSAQELMEESVALTAQKVLASSGDQARHLFQNGKIYTNFSPVRAQYRFMPKLEVLGSDVLMMLRYACALEIITAFSGDYREKPAYQRDYMRYRSSAIQVDSRNNPYRRLGASRGGLAARNRVFYGESPYGNVDAYFGVGGC